MLAVVWHVWFASAAPITDRLGPENSGVAPALPARRCGLPKEFDCRPAIPSHPRIRWLWLLSRAPAASQVMEQVPPWTAGTTINKTGIYEETAGGSTAPVCAMGWRAYVAGCAVMVNLSMSAAAARPWSKQTKVSQAGCSLRIVIAVASCTAS